MSEKITRLRQGEFLMDARISLSTPVYRHIDPGSTRGTTGPELFMRYDHDDDNAGCCLP